MTQNTSLVGAKSSTTPLFTNVTEAPAEILVNIISRLPSLDLVSCSLVNKRLSQELNNDEILKKIYEQKFGVISPEVKGIKEAYIRKNNAHWNYKHGIYLNDVLEGHVSAVVSSLLFDGDDLYSVSLWDYLNKVKLWDVKLQECKDTFAPQSMHGASIAVAEDKVFLGSAKEGDGSIRVYDKSAKIWLSSLCGHKSIVSVLAVAERDKKKILISGSVDTKIMIWDLESMTSIQALEGHTDKVKAFAVAENKLFSASEDQIIIVWDLNSLERVGTLKGHQGTVNSLAIDGNRLFSASSDKSIFVWDIHSLTKVTALEGHQGAVSKVIIANHLLISGAWDYKMKIWNLDDLTCSATLHDPKNPITALVEKDGIVYTDATATTQIKVRNFSVSRRAVLQQIAVELKDPKLENEETLGRFNRMPNDELTRRIYEKNRVNRSSNLPALSSGIDQQIWQVSNSLQKAKAIEDCLKPEGSTT